MKSMIFYSLIVISGLAFGQESLEKYSANGVRKWEYTIYNLEKTSQVDWVIYCLIDEKTTVRRRTSKDKESFFCDYQFSKDNDENIACIKEYYQALERRFKR